MATLSPAPPKLTVNTPFWIVLYVLLLVVLSALALLFG
jgi:hypothetical protein